MRPPPEVRRTYRAVIVSVRDESSLARMPSLAFDIPRLEASSVAVPRTIIAA
jgi:hypothetical protein